MIPWEHLDTAALPGGGTLRLMRRGGEFSIRLGQIELMNSRMFGSEEALARLGCERLRTARPDVLVGGLGMGFTLRAALAVLGPEARVTVAELVPAVVAWARGPLAAIFAGCLDDDRVVVRERDVAELIRGARRRWDAVLLDVDNGPDGLTVPENDGLYDGRGLGAVHAALRPGGVLAVWSSAPDRRFTERMRRTAFDVEEVRVRAKAGGGGGSRHVIWLGRR